ncbi:MAG: hypothetical protein KJZ68_11405 [Phycisphaerales bacterium]|nr:hypothetical protein [Phycisphaerales bacterium]
MSTTTMPLDSQRIRPERLSPAARAGIFAFGLVAYLAFFVTICWGIAFVGNWIVPKTIDSGTPGPIIPSLLINGSILLLFVVQHTIMARPAFKRWWTRIVPAPMERSIFVLLASGILLLLFWQWRPLPTVVWEFTHPVAVYGLSALSVLGWGIVFLSSFLINHFDLFGLRQAWFALRARAYKPVGFRLTFLYRLVRHPLMVGFLIAFWSTPVMTVGHLFFAIMTTGYILFGTHVEERDLIAEHGQAYLDYRKRVRGLIPLPKRMTNA